MYLLLQITSAKIYELNITTIYTKMKKETLALVFLCEFRKLINVTKKVP